MIRAVQRLTESNLDFLFFINDVAEDFPNLQEFLHEQLNETLLTVLTCPGVGSGGDEANIRGIRFNIDQDFTHVKTRMAGRTAGVYSIDAELRRSSDFIGPTEAVVSDQVVNVPANNSVPFSGVTFNFGFISVTGNETFSLKFIVNDGPGNLLLEVFGIGSTSCANVEVTNENDIANPTERTDPAGFEVFFVP